MAAAATALAIVGAATSTYRPWPDSAVAVVQPNASAPPSALYRLFDRAIFQSFFWSVGPRLFELQMMFRMIWSEAPTHW